MSEREKSRAALIAELEKLRRTPAGDSEVRFRALFEQTAVPCFVHDLDGRFLDVNQATLDKLGYTREEMRALHIADTHPETKRTEGQAAFEKVITTGSVTFETVVLTKSGEELPAEITSTMVSVGGHRIVQGVLVDLTDRQRAEENLRASEQKFRAIVDNIGIGVALISPDMKVLELNRQMREWFPNADPAMRPICYHAYHDPPSDGFCNHCPTLKTLRDGRVHEAVSITPQGGDLRNYRIVSSPIIDADGSVTGAIEMVEDITERKKLETEIAQSERLASLGTLAAGVAHEITNPLASVMHGLEQLAGAAPEGPDREELNRILSDARRIHDIVRGLHTFSRIDNERVGPVDLARIVDIAADMAANEIKHCARLVREHDDAPLVLGNEGPLCQVFLNTLVNATHAIGEGDIDNNEIRVRTRAQGDVAVVEVRDTGAGVAPEHLPRVFEPFFSTKDAGVGSGLGLAISKNIVEGYGGTMQVESELGRGSTFTVRLPGTDSGRPVPVATPRRRDLAPEMRGRILLVDDEDGVRRAMARFLADHELVEAAGGAEAKRILSEDQAFDVVVCDLMMPDVSGMDLHAWLRREHPRLAERLVFVTGGAFTPGASAYLERVDNVRLQKPFDRESLRRTVADWVSRARA